MIWSRTLFKRALTSMLAPAWLACGGSDLVLPEGPTSTPANITIVKGNAQAGAPSAMLRDSIVVKVTDDTGAPLAGQQVEFAPESPGAAVSPQVSTTDADGLAGARWVLGPAAGPQEAVAKVVGGSDQLRVKFVARATAGTPDLTLAISTQPGSSATIGVGFDRQPVIQLRDQSGVDVKSSGVAVVAAVASGAGTLGGTTTRLTDSDGKVEFTDLRIDGGIGPHLLIFAAPGYRSVVSTPIEVQPLTARNSPPTAVSDEYTTLEGNDHILTVGTEGGLLQNDRDPEGGPLTASDVSDSPNGEINLEDDGSFTYAPAPNFFGDDRYTYTATDESGNSSSATITIHVSPVNDPPAFNDRGDPPRVSTNAGRQTVRDWAFGAHAGAENEGNQALEFVVIGNSNPGLFTQGGQPAVTREGPESRNGTVRYSGTLRYTPSGQSGSATITVVLRDSGGTANGGVDTSTPHSFTIRVRS
jgi:hypothetical protein